MIKSFRSGQRSILRTRSKSGKMPESFPPLCIRYYCRYLLSQSVPLWLLPCFTQDISPARCSASPKCLKSWRRWISVFSAGKKERMKSGCWPAIWMSFPDGLSAALDELEKCKCHAFGGCGERKRAWEPPACIFLCGFPWIKDANHDIKGAASGNALSCRRL